ncbi:hypothetical protein J4439_04280 [Candidatus Woesearchaeota archaeon]|nr:hypothetical protein [Candidatus Woesearchaeota archaeon]
MIPDLVDIARQFHRECEAREEPILPASVGEYDEVLAFAELVESWRSGDQVVVRSMSLGGPYAPVRTYVIDGRDIIGPTESYDG